MSQTHSDNKHEHKSDHKSSGDHDLSHDRDKKADIQLKIVAVIVVILVGVMGFIFGYVYRSVLSPKARSTVMASDMPTSTKKDVDTNSHKEDNEKETYFNETYGFFFQYPTGLKLVENIGVYQSGVQVIAQDEIKTGDIVVNVEGINDLPEVGMDDTRYIALDRKSALEYKDTPSQTSNAAGYSYGEVLSLGANMNAFRMVKLTGGQTAPNTFDLSQRVHVYSGDYQITIIFNGDKKTVAKSMPEYFDDTNNSATGSASTTSSTWLSPDKVDLFYASLEDDTGSKELLKWNGMVKDIISTITVQ